MARNEVNDREKIRINKDNLKKLYAVFGFTRPYMRYLIPGMVFLMLSSLTLLAFPYLVGKLIDVATGKEEWIFRSLESIALILIGILFVQGIFSFLRVYLFALTSEKSVADIRKALFRKYMVLPLAFYDRSRIGELISRITADVTLLHDSLSITLAEFIRQVATLLIGTLIIFFTTPKLTFFMLAVFPLVIVLGLVFGRFIRKLSRETQDHLSKTNVIVEETLQAIREVKAFTNELREIRRYGESMGNVVSIALRTAIFRGGFISFIIFALFGTIVAVIWYGATLVSQEMISVGDLLSFVLYTTFIGGSIAGLGDIYSQLQRSVGASERIMDILREEEEPTSTGFKGADIHLNEKITFRKVTFAYPTRKDQTVLRELSLEIWKGEKIALVGPSGAGKSTIIQLLLRYYLPDEGSIFLDGNDIQDLDLTVYRNRIAIVPQEVILFGGTIKENILYGKPDAGDADIEQAAREANALDFIMSFPEGMETLVGERGVKLSGGQRQRIAIARAILRNPDILILDEATSSLDSNAEYQVKEALDRLMQDRTTIIIAHRLATIRKVDMIYVIQGGRIVESGAHEDLLQQMNGVYANLIKMQISLTE
jgi:ABC-type multidrug transport system fused ATPase/permease subunit